VARVKRSTEGERQGAQERRELSPVEAIVRWRADPVLFANEVLGARPWKRQAELMRAIARSDDVAIRSGQKTGKSEALVYVAIWWVLCFPEARVIMTAPTHRQIKDVLWSALMRVYQRARAPIGGVMNQTPNGGFRLPDGRAILGFSTDKPVNWGGYSGTRLLFLGDEASGLSAGNVEAIDGNRIGGGSAKLVLSGNPTQTSGVFFDAFHANAARWDKHHVSSLEASEAGIPGLATRASCEQRRREYGEASPFYQVRVLGNFPTEGDDAIVTLAMVTDAERDWEHADEAGRLEIGVDPARFGSDDSAICVRRGMKVLAFKAIHGKDVMQVAGEALAGARQFRKGDEKALFRVDTIGVGAGVADALRLCPKLCDVEDVNSSERAFDEDKYANTRAELHFVAANWLKAGGKIPPNTPIGHELTAARYDFDPRGRHRVEAKDAVKKRIGKSPDAADAFLLSVYVPSAGLGPVEELGPDDTVIAYNSPIANW
jgi:phage terminase large subunit